MKRLKYEVYAVDRAGTPWRVAEMSDPQLALACIELCRAKTWPNERVFGITETDEPEKGDVQMELEEEVAAADEREASRCGWCKRLPEEGCNVEVHNAPA